MKRLILYFLFCALASAQPPPTTNKPLSVDANGNRLPTNVTYENFGGGTAGSTGFGIRNNSGTMQFKNSGGSWADLGAGGTVSTGKTLWVDAVNGSNSTGTRGRLDKPFLTIAAAITAASAGDLIKVGPGTFDLSTSRLTLPANVSLAGSGIDVTSITSNISGSSSPVITLGNSSTVSDLTVTNSSTDGTAGPAIGGNAVVFTNARLINVKATGDVDALYVRGTSGNPSSLTAINCIFTGKFDTINVITFGTVECYHCVISVSGVSSGGVGGGVVASGTGSGGGIVRFFGGSITLSGANTTNSAFETRGSGALCSIEAYNVRVNVSGASNNYDANGGNGTVYHSNISRSDGGALSTNGTVSSLSRNAIRDNNLSDLTSASTALSNLGAQPLDADLTSWAAITRSSGFDTFTASPSGANLASLLTSAVPYAKGGTGLTSYTVGDIPFFNNAATSLSVLADVATGNALLSGGVGAAPSYGKITTSHTTGIASIAFIAKTTTYTAVSGDKILANTSGGSFTITLPASPSVGDNVYFVDAQGSFTAHALTIGRNSQSIAGAASDLTASTDNEAFQLIFAGGSMGWQVVRYQ